jgi:Ala-tRNA(Pro) deacylase
MKLFDYLDQKHASYSVSQHRPAFTAQVMAAEEHEKGRYVAKPVLIHCQDGYVMCVLAAPDKIDYVKLRDYLGGGDIRLASEEKMKDLFPDCEEGAEPPFGHLYGLRTITDRALERDDHIVFQAGTHDKAVHMRMKDYLALAQPEIADFAEHPDS